MSVPGISLWNYLKFMKFKLSIVLLIALIAIILVRNHGKKRSILFFEQALNEHMNKNYFLISNLSNFTNFKWDNVYLEHDMLYQSVFLKFTHSGNTVDAKSITVDSFAIPTDTLWIDEDYALKSPSGKKYDINSNFLFYKKINNKSGRIYMESISMTEPQILENLQKLTHENIVVSTPAKNIFTFKWNSVAINEKFRFVYVDIIMNDQSNIAIFNKNVITIGKKIIGKSILPNDIIFIKYLKGGIFLIRDIQRKE